MVKIKIEIAGTNNNPEVDVDFGDTWLKSHGKVVEALPGFASREFLDCDELIDCGGRKAVFISKTRSVEYIRAKIQAGEGLNQAVTSYLDALRKEIKDVVHGIEKISYTYETIINTDGE